MPKSKRSKLVTLAKTDKKGRDLKQKLIESVRESVDKYSHVYVFTVANMRNRILKEVREHWKESRMFLGKNRVMALALGRSKNDEYRPDLHRVSLRLRGECGLLFTNSAPEEVVQYFQSFKIPEFARAGVKAEADFTLPAGPLVGLQSSMEPELRKLGLESRLNKGTIELAIDHPICKVGDVLTPEQCRILKMFDQQLSMFEASIHCSWSNEEFVDMDDVDMEA